MAKITVVFLTLIMLGVWGWLSWGEYTRHTDLYQVLPSVPESPTIDGFLQFVCGIPEDHKLLGTSDDVEQTRSNMQVSLGAIVALSATMVFAVTGGSGAIFSVMVTAFVSFLAAAANMLFVLHILVQIGWFVFRPDDPVEYQLSVFGLVLYGLLSVVTAFTIMRQMPNLVRGKRSAMHAVMKCLLILMIASAGFAPLGLPPQFVLYGYHGAYWLAALCLLSLMFIGMTHSNYQYD